MNPKFGKVFVVKQMVAENGIVTIPKLLESVLFSNIDHKWYDLEGNLSPQYENYSGRRISLQFKIAHPDKHGKGIEFLAKVPLPLLLGELKPQDFESVPEETQKMVKLWEAHGMLSGDPATDDSYRVLRDLQCTSTVAALCPGWKISDMKSLHASLDPYFIQDELIDKDNSQKNMPFKLAHPYFSAMTNILEGKMTVEEALQKLTKLPERYKKPLRGFSQLRNEFSKKEEYTHHLYLAYRDFHEGISFDNCSEWKKQQQKCSAMYSFLLPQLRMATIGALAAFEMIAFDQDLRVSKTIRESFLFRSLLNVYSQHSSLVNDLWSCKKEMAGGETSNVVYFYHFNKGLSLEDAYQKTIDKIANATQVVSEIGEMLVALYGEEYPEATKVMELVKNIMYGNIQWSTINARYNPNIVYDCVVELDNICEF